MGIENDTVLIRGRAADLLQIVHEIRDVWGFMPGVHYDWSYHSAPPRHATFRFYDPQHALWFALKYL